MLALSSSFSPMINPHKHFLSVASSENQYPKPKNTRTYIFPLFQSTSNFSFNKYFPLSNLVKSIDDFVSDVMSTPLPPYLDPKQVLSENFFRVDEFPPTPCDVVHGSLPSCLNGAYIRNGPNPQFIPDRGGYHLFDGDGMLHMIRISHGRALFCSRYVQTYKYMVEKKIGYPFFPSAFASFNGMGLIRCGLLFARTFIGQFDPFANGFGTANTSLALIGGRLFALGESDLPYEIRVTSDGDIITIGRHNIFKTNRPFLNMGAHPKTDLDTKETFSLRHNFIVPRLTFFRMDLYGRKQSVLPIFSVKTTSVTHDFALTKNFIVFPDVQIVLDMMEIARGKSPVRVVADKKPRIGVLPRYAEDEKGLTWIDAPGFNILHCLNAWEEDDGQTIVMVASIISESALQKFDLRGLRLEKIAVNIQEKTLKRHSLSSETLELGVINPAYAGKKSRYVYATIIAEPKRATGVVKIDLSSAMDSSDHVVACHHYGLSCCGSEPFFVPREYDNPKAEEDDGYLVMYFDDENNKESMFLVMDAKSPTLETVAIVKLPGRVPSGFHGLFLREIDIQKL